MHGYHPGSPVSALSVSTVESFDRRGLHKSQSLRLESASRKSNVYCLRAW
jgi:hypothetical protein